MEPAYIQTHEKGLLVQRIAQSRALLASCRVCPRRCGISRLRGETGLCRTGRWALVASWTPHFGEEAPLVGRFGSGTIFFTYCSLQCVFCQNHDISYGGQGERVGPDDLASMMLGLQSRGVHNINLVTPTHVVPQILEALPTAIERGLRLPLVYNSGGYDRVETLKLLDGIVDIYMPDLKFSRDIPPMLYCRAPDYDRIVQTAIQEMHRQVGDLVLDENGRAARGLLVRHLVMPDGLAGTREAMRFLAREISVNTYVNIMDQYRPCGEIDRFPELARPVTPREYEQALDDARAEGIMRLDRRERPLLLAWR